MGFFPETGLLDRFDGRIPVAHFSQTGTEGSGVGTDDGEARVLLFGVLPRSRVFGLSNSGHLKRVGRIGEEALVGHHY